MLNATIGSRACSSILLRRPGAAPGAGRRGARQSVRLAGPPAAGPARRRPAERPGRVGALVRLLPLDVVTEEFNELFISSGAPRISPHGSIYLAGFLHEKPLVHLRADLAALGLGRQAGARETEDHLGALCEGMRQLIVRRQPIEAQQRFFDSHIASWSSTCLTQLQRLDGARFYAAVAELAAALFAIERQAFEVADEAA